MLSAAEHRRRDLAPACQHGSITIDLHLHILMFGRVIIQRSVHDRADIDFLRLPHTRHVNKHKAVIVDTFKLRSVLFHHCGIHLFV